MDINGLLILNKPAGMTSHTAVARVRHLVGADKAGHTGTLDPLATGVLPVLLGRAAKASAFLTEQDKHYIAIMRLGLSTDTQDITGTVLSRSENIPSSDRVLRALSCFTGDLMQVPPMYSALKVGGQKLVDLARRGITVDRQARPITVYDLTPTQLTDREWALDVRCSKGTYIRTLCADIGQALGCGAVMTDLCRAGAAGFTLSDAVTLDQLAGESAEQRAAHIRPVDSLFSDLPAVTLPDFYARLAHAGQQIYLYKIRQSFPSDTRVRLYDGTGFFALGEVRTYDDGPAIKPIRQFSSGQS